MDNKKAKKLVFKALTTFLNVSTEIQENQVKIWKKLEQIEASNMGFTNNLEGTISVLRSEVRNPKFAKLNEISELVRGLYPKPVRKTKQDRKIQAKPRKKTITKKRK